MSRKTHYEDEPAVADTSGVDPNTTADAFVTAQERNGMGPAGTLITSSPATLMDLDPTAPYPTGAPDPEPVSGVPHNQKPPETA